mmetsp:Transcript_10910/g.22100  ORF Transcript_10910/g.22100 Transcript_10910/m.22100 type:complete len:230 (-) Transcript_10910:224-913(-)
MDAKAGLTLALMRAGAPNAEVLSAKTAADLIAVAHRHGIALPESLASSQDQPTVTSADKEPSGGDPPPVSGRGGFYEGERNSAGQWEGRGRYTFADGSVYEGEWRANQQDGHGTFRFHSGNLYYGQWKAGKKHGHGTFGYADGRVEVGTYVADRDVGEGAMWSHDRRIAWRILQDGLECSEISPLEAKSIADRIGEPVPAPGDWLSARLAALQATEPGAEEGGGGDGVE